MTLDILKASQVLAYEGKSQEGLTEGQMASNKRWEGSLALHEQKLRGVVSQGSFPGSLVNLTVCTVDGARALPGFGSPLNDVGLPIFALETYDKCDAPQN